MIKTIGVIGAGQMGNGIAHVCAASGFDVKLVDLSQDQLDAALVTINKNMDRQVKRSLLSEDDKAAALGRIETGVDYALFGGCDFVIEAATENEEIKRAVFQQLLPHLKADALLASNTSSISITRLAASTDRPERFIGMHFMLPVPVMKLVELIRGLATDEETFQAIKTLAETLGKDVAVAEDFPAFIVNRILLPMINEAARTGRLHWSRYMPVDHAGAV
jgi:3-hydroxybutyryl-CoA dehydrogenase